MGFHHLIFLTAKPAKDLAGEFQYALLNTVMGITIVFVVLILISFIIHLFKGIYKIQNRPVKPVLPEAAPLPPSLVQAAEAKEEIDDLELIAVLTAAIYAYETGQGNPLPAGGFIVRSVRRVNRIRI